MKILKLYGHKNNNGGIVHFQNGLKVHNTDSSFKYYHFRTGSINNNKWHKYKIIRLTDQLMSWLFFPFYLLCLNPDAIEINSSLVPKAFKRDRVYAKITRLVKPKSLLVLFNHGWNYNFKNQLFKKNKNSVTDYFNTFDRIIVLAGTFKNQIEELGVSSDKIRVITTGINLKDFSNVKTSFNEGKSHFNILFLSRIEEAKGIKEFIESLPLVLRNYNNITYHIAGSGSYFETVKNHPIVFSNDQYFKFHGYVRGHEKLKLLKSADLFVFPSYGEGCPVSVLEALAVGLPIIYTEVGALPDILKNNKNGIKVKKHSSKEIADAIISLLNDETLRIKISKNNRNYSVNFDLAIIHKKLENIYTT